MGLADGTVGDEDEDLGSEKSIAISALHVRTLLFIGIGCAEKCATSATSKSSKHRQPRHPLRTSWTWTRSLDLEGRSTSESVLKSWSFSMLLSDVVGR